MSIIGLGLIFVAWLYQLYYVVTARPAIRPFFLIIYVAGVAFLVYDGFRAGLFGPAWLNLVILIPVTVIFWKIWRQR